MHKQTPLRISLLPYSISISNTTLVVKDFLNAHQSEEKACPPASVEWALEITRPMPLCERMRS